MIMKKINILIAFILLGLSNSFAWNEESYPIGTDGYEFIPGFADENSAESYMYVYANEDKTEVKFVEVKYHVEPRMDAFTLYQNEIFNIPEYITADGKKCKVVAIESNAFNNPKVTQVSLPSTVKIIEPNTFEANNLSSLNLGNGLRIIMFNSFRRMDVLTALAIPGSVYQIQDNCFVDLSALKTLSFGEGLFFIGNGCFNNLGDIEEIALPKSLKSIGNECFNDCVNLKKVVIPKWIDGISQSFNGCPNIEEIRFLNTTGSISISESFKDVDLTKCRVIVPDGSKNKYKRFNFPILLEESEAAATVTQGFIQPSENSTEIYDINGNRITSERNLKKGEIYIKSENGNATKLIYNN